MTTSPKYIYNGKTYNSLEEMPEEARQFLKDENQNGIPDVLDETLGGLNLEGILKNPTVQKIIYRGQVVDKLGDLPPEKLREVREKLGQLGQFLNRGATPSSQNSSLPSAMPTLPGQSSASKLYILLMVLIGLFVMVGIAGFFFFRFLESK